MNRNLTLLTALGAGLALAPFAAAQAPAAAAAPAAPVAPVAVPAKIAVVYFEQVVRGCNEGQVATVNTQKKYEPRGAEIQKEGEEVETLKKTVTPTMTDDAKTKLLHDIDIKEKKLQRDFDEAQSAYSADLQEVLSPIVPKIAAAIQKYATDNGFTIVLDVSSQQSNIVWALPQTDISQAVVDMYNKQSGIAAPAPQGPAPAAKPAAPRPAAPKPATPPKQ
jgi:Skp family chaperone for outer membrane proteins